jgi:hypothetical protein
MDPHGLKRRKQKHRWTWHVGHDASEFFGRLVHGPPDKPKERTVQHRNSDQNNDDFSFCDQGHG